MIKFAYDKKQMKPGCVLLQAAFGCETSIAQLFPTDLWLLHPTPDMKVYQVPDRKALNRVVVITEEHHSKKKRK